MEPVSIRTADHYVWGDGCDGWHLVKTAELSVIEERMPPGTSEERHFHKISRQFFYVVAGELTMDVAGARHVLPAGTGLEIEPGKPHQAINSSSADVRFVVVSQPPSHADRVTTSK